MHSTAREDAPYRRVSLGDLTPAVERRADGTILVRAIRPLSAYPARFTERLAYWARVAPERALLATRVEGRFVPLTYAAALRDARSLGQALLDRRLSADRPLAILSGNSREHLLLALAAQHVGVPFAPVSPAYSLVSSDFTTLRHVIARLSPGMVFVSDAGPFARALRAVLDPTVEVVCGSPSSLGDRPTTPFVSLVATTPTEAVDLAHAAVGPDTVAKILFTSGSTGVPKGVINTHRMLNSNQQMILETLPLLGEEPPILVDWLPWHHTFGGNHNIGLTLYNGGTLYLDEGRPMPGAFEESVRSLREVAPTTYFNVPKGYEELVKALGRDRALAQRFFSRLRVLFYAAAALPQHVADELQRIAVDACGERVLLVTGLGATETAPMAICRPWKSPLASAIGLPVPGLEVKLVPAGERLEVRVRGPNVTPGYWRDPELTRAAFDDEGFYGMGDAVRLVDAADLAQGLIFDGRLKEDFKLSTGTWVHVGPLRAKVIAHFAPCVRDAVITGHDRDEVAMLAVADVDACRSLAGDLPADAPLAAIVAHPAVRASLEERLVSFGAQATGSATRVVRAILLDEALSLDAGELTDKGSVNQRAVLQRRTAMVQALYDDPPPSYVISPAAPPEDTGVNLDALIAIDVHVHLEHGGALTETEKAATKHFGDSGASREWGAQAEYYRSRRIGCVVFTVEERLTGRPHATNEQVLAFAAEHADIAIPFVSLDPTRGPEAVADARRLIAAGGVRGLKLHPPVQQFFPNDRIAYPLYEVFAEARLPVIFHTGHSGIGTGMPGGGGIRLKYGNPMAIDDVAVDFPDLPIIMAHPSFPWQDEAISVCLHKPQVYIDLSGWSPKYFSPTLVQYANSLLKRKVLFGSDYPWITPDRWLADFAQIGIKDEVRPLILKENTAKLFGLGIGL